MIYSVLSISVVQRDPVSLCLTHTFFFSYCFLSCLITGDWIQFPVGLRFFFLMKHFYLDIITDSDAVIRNNTCACVHARAHLILCNFITCVGSWIHRQNQGAGPFHRHEDPWCSQDPEVQPWTVCSVSQGARASIGLSPLLGTPCSRCPG